MNHITAQRAGLTRREKEAFDFVNGFLIDNRGIAPSYDEIKDHLGLASKSGVHRLLHALRRKSWLKFQDVRARSLAVVQHTCPHCGGEL